MDNLFYLSILSFNFIICSHHKKLHLLFVQEIKHHKNPEFIIFRNMLCYDLISFLETIVLTSILVQVDMSCDK
jgi:hypothetical protein